MWGSTRGSERSSATVPRPSSPTSGCSCRVIGTGTNCSANFVRALPITKTRTKIGLDIGERQRHRFFDGIRTAAKVRRAFPTYSLVILDYNHPFPPFAHLARFYLRRRPARFPSLTRPTATERRPKCHRSISERQAGVASRLGACSSSRAAAWPPSSRSLTTSAYVEPELLQSPRGQSRFV